MSSRNFAKDGSSSSEDTNSPSPTHMRTVVSRSHSKDMPKMMYAQAARFVGGGAGSDASSVAATRRIMLVAIGSLAMFTVSLSLLLHLSGCHLSEADLLLGTSTSSTTTTSTSTSSSSSSSTNTAHHDHAEKYIRHTYGTEWKMWDGQSVLHPKNWDDKLECNWALYKPAHALPEAPFAPICLHPTEKDRDVSGSILRTGKWSDCDSLTPILNDAPGRDDEKVHIEIGANIGSCVMQVLLTTKAQIYAFEPHPKNLFYLTSTLMQLDPSYRDRVHLFPIALGEETSFSNIVINRQNAGNAQVLTPGKTGKRGHTIRIESLDDILDPRLPISLIKMDAQGFECYIVSGMPRTLSSAHSVVFEVEADQSTRFKECTPASLVSSIRNADFNIYRLPVEGKDDKAPDDLPDFDNFTGLAAVDLVALKRVHIHDTNQANIGTVRRGRN